MSDPNAADKSKTPDASKQSDKEKSESSKTDPIADALMKRVAELEAQLKAKPTVAPTIPADLAEMKAMAEIVMGDLASKLLPSITPDQMKAVQAAISGKSIAESRAMLLAFQAVLPHPTPTNGVGAPSTKGGGPGRYESGHVHKYIDNSKTMVS